MKAEFRITPLPAGLVFGDVAPQLLVDLAGRYEREAHIEVKHWAMWVFDSGPSVPVPTQLSPESFPTVRACQLLKQSLEQVARVEMHKLSEADRFLISTAIDQLEEFKSLGVA